MNLTVSFRLFLFALVLATAPACSAAEDIKVIADVPYKSGTTLTDYEKETCKLDLYLPTGHKDFSTLV